MQDLTTKDRNGNTIAVGATVRVISVHSSVFESLAEDERSSVLSMVGACLEVYEVDQYGRAWVEKWWYGSDESAMSHSLGLEPENMELVPNALL